MSNLEHPRKQAKSYLRWHRERYYPVAVQIRSVLARFRDLSDREVLDAGFKLSDAQELVARKSGFESWPALIKRVSSRWGAAEPAKGQRARVRHRVSFQGS